MLYSIVILVLHQAMLAASYVNNHETFQESSIAERLNEVDKQAGEYRRQILPTYMRAGFAQEPEYEGILFQAAVEVGFPEGVASYWARWVMRHLYGEDIKILAREMEVRDAMLFGAFSKASAGWGGAQYEPSGTAPVSSSSGAVEGEDHTHAGASGPRGAFDGTTDGDAGASDPGRGKTTTTDEEGTTTPLPCLPGDGDEAYSCGFGYGHGGGTNEDILGGRPPSGAAPSASEAAEAENVTDSGGNPSFVDEGISREVGPPA